MDNFKFQFGFNRVVTLFLFIILLFYSVTLIRNQDELKSWKKVKSTIISKINFKEERTKNQLIKKEKIIKKFWIPRWLSKFITFDLRDNVVLNKKELIKKYKEWWEILFEYFSKKIEWKKIVVISTKKYLINFDGEKIISYSTKIPYEKKDFLNRLKKWWKNLFLKKILNWILLNKREFELINPYIWYLDFESYKWDYLKLKDKKFLKNKMEWKLLKTIKITKYDTNFRNFKDFYKTIIKSN